MSDLSHLTETQRLLLMAAAVQGLGPKTSLMYANTWRIVDQALRWLGLSADEVRSGWRESDCDSLHDEVYNALIKLTRATHLSPNDGTSLFEGSGNWGVFGDPSRPACWPQYNSCRLTPGGELVAQELLRRYPEYQKRVEAYGRPPRQEES